MKRTGLAPLVLVLLMALLLAPAGAQGPEGERPGRPAAGLPEQRPVARPAARRPRTSPRWYPLRRRW